MTRTVSVNVLTTFHSKYDLFDELEYFGCNSFVAMVLLAPFLDIADGPTDDRNLDDILREVKEIIKDAWTLPEDERKKVIKRLYKKWHPDKNHGNEAVATKVFQFIKQIVFRMESGQDIDTKCHQDFDHLLVHRLYPRKALNLLMSLVSYD
jgi:hypothetical protein